MYMLFLRRKYRDVNMMSIINIHGGGETIINGKVYKNLSGQMTITDKGVFVNGKPIEECDEPFVLKVEINGNVESVDSENADVTINGSAGSVVSKNGNIHVSRDVTGSVETKNGNIIIGGGVGGDVTTKNGNIDRF